LGAPYLIMKRSTAIALAQLRSTNGDHSFPDVGAMGGEIWGVPVLTSESAPADSNSPADNIIVLVDAAEVLLAEGPIDLRSWSMSRCRWTTTPTARRRRARP
jgi:Phage capsid family